MEQSLLTSGASAKANNAQREIGRWDHQCPGCGAFIRWALTFCFDCGRNQPKGNPAYKT